MKIEETLGIIKSFVKNGHTPKRGDEQYQSSGNFVNCFEHALLNFTNEQLEMLDCGYTTENLFGCLLNVDVANLRVQSKNVEINMFAFICEIGLKAEIEKVQKLKLAKNQWRIARYHAPNAWHFILQEPNGEWSSKEGWTQRVRHLTELVHCYEAGSIDYPFSYLLQQSYIITNPYAEAE